MSSTAGPVSGTTVGHRSAAGGEPDPARDDTPATAPDAVPSGTQSGTQDGAHDGAHDGVPAGGRRGSRSSVRDMLSSTLVVVGAVLVIVALVPRPNAQPIRAVDVVAAAREATSRLPFTPAVPQGLPAGWVVTEAGVRRSADDGITTWHIGYVTPDGHNASVEQAAHVTSQWISIMDSGGLPRPPVRVDGTLWVQHYKDVREVTALIHSGPDRTTMITSKVAGLANAQLLARSIPASQR